MPVYKVSFVIQGGEYTGAILNMDHPPEIGELVVIGSRAFEVIEVLDLLPPRGEFHYLHVTCKVSQPDHVVE